ncbi:diaminopimelate decarboxylase [Ligilactobacillus sp. LYQ60]|uniref:diaminopimelate decarboxylase n=1 Tax=unclassified Ligilactobacillus TaxID=2767920 RepID=UPI00385248D8
MSFSHQFATTPTGHLMLGGCDALTLARKYGTPLIVYDVDQLKAAVSQFTQTLAASELTSAVCYASKAFSCIAIYQLMARLGCHVDVVSGGELYTALQAHFPPERICFHGNNKTKAELEFAITKHVGTIVIDNFHEINLLKQVLTNQNATVNVMLRVTPGVQAHTHRYITTGQIDSKFGFDLASGQATTALQWILACPRMNFIGVHAHIGSQIFVPDGFVTEINRLCTLIAQWARNFAVIPAVLDIGGGFGIQYTNDEHPVPVKTILQTITTTVKQSFKQAHLPLPALWVEPGRAIVGPAGTTLYTVGSEKHLPGRLPYVAVDGGMGDNIRPALYDAHYTALNAACPTAPAINRIRLVGKYCESGDVLVDDLRIAPLSAGDIVAIPVTGAYGYSMASNYNRNCRPAVVFAQRGHSQLVIRRESYSQLVINDLPYEGSN